MKQFISFIIKEYYHITRDVRTMIMMLLIPVVLMLIFGFAISTEVKNTSFVVLDNSKTSASQGFIEKINNNPYFKMKGYLSGIPDIEKVFQKGKAKVALVIPENFANNIYRGENSNIQIEVDASDPNEASTIINYIQLLTLQYQQELNKSNANFNVISTEMKMLYNPQLKSAYNIVPGIMGLVLMLICAMMTSISIVREKELGTMEILLVSPLKPTSIILAKAIPYFILSMIDVTTILLLSYFVLDVPIVGSLFLVIFLSVLFTLSALSLGLLISSMVETQQAAMMLSAIGLMLPTMLLSGLVFPIESMPKILQVISNIIPAKWYIAAVRKVFIKGLGFMYIWKESLILLSMITVLLTISIKKFKDRL